MKHEFGDYFTKNYKSEIHIIDGEVYIKRDGELKKRPENNYSTEKDECEHYLRKTLKITNDCFVMSNYKEINNFALELLEELDTKREQVLFALQLNEVINAKNKRGKGIGVNYLVDGFEEDELCLGDRVVFHDQDSDTIIGEGIVDEGEWQLIISEKQKIYMHGPFVKTDSPEETSKLTQFMFDGTLGVDVFVD